ncbi:MAG TPA: iron-sulfur cluster assembly protein [Trueperaceae bacterium]|nr:iron-sulfur cluster assembly protein [Trueperaceae bacterium]
MSEGSTADETPTPAAAHPAATARGSTPANDDMRNQVLEALKVVRDPEIPVNVVDLGLVYDVQIDDNGQVAIEMTLTSMGCPVQDLIQTDAELAVMKVDGVNAVNVEFVWSPPWTPQKMTDDGKKQMRMFGFNL